MEWSEFARNLQRHGAYRTCPNPRHFGRSRLLLHSDLWFYVRLILVIASGRLSVWRGTFDALGWHIRAVRILKLIESAGGVVDISGVHHVTEAQEPFVFAANHMSMMETMLLPGAILLPFVRLTTVIKESLLRYPLFGPIMRYVGGITVGRTQPRDDLQHVLEQGVRALREGTSVLLFPQSTRTRHFAPSDFNSLGVKLARRAGIPLVPVALKTDFQGINRIRWIRDLGPLDRRQTIHFQFGAPMAIEGTGRKQHEHIVGWIAAQLRAWGVDVRGDLPTTRRAINLAEPHDTAGPNGKE